MARLAIGTNFLAEDRSRSSAPCSSRRSPARISWSRILLSAADPSLASSIFSKPELLQKIANDPDHGVVVVHHQNRHRQINRHLQSPREARSSMRAKTNDKTCQAGRSSPRGARPFKPAPSVRLQGLASAVKQPVNRPSGTHEDRAHLDRPGLTSIRPAASRSRAIRTPNEAAMTSRFTVIRDTTPSAEIPRGSVVAMGNFDGVHLGHRAVIAAALEMSRSHKQPAFAVTFEPHPAQLFQPQQPPVPAHRRGRKTAAVGRDRAFRRCRDDLRQGPRRDHRAGFHSP